MPSLVEIVLILGDEQGLEFSKCLIKTNVTAASKSLLYHSNCDTRNFPSDSSSGNCSLPFVYLLFEWFNEIRWI